MKLALARDSGSPGSFPSSALIPLGQYHKIQISYFRSNPFNFKAMTICDAAYTCKPRV